MHGLSPPTRYRSREQEWAHSPARLYGFSWKLAAKKNNIETTD
jgi:hypothetical protein